MGRFWEHAVAVLDGREIIIDKPGQTILFETKRMSVLIHVGNPKPKGSRHRRNVTMEITPKGEEVAFEGATLELRNGNSRHSEGFSCFGRTSIDNVQPGKRTIELRPPPET